MLNRLDHVGIVVDDLAQAKQFLGEILGLPLVREFAMPERSMAAAFYSLGNAEIEVIELTNPGERQRRLGDGALARIDHVAIGVDDVAKAATALQERGIAFQTAAPNTTALSTSIFSRPASSDGVVFQLIKWLEADQKAQPSGATAD